MKLISDKNVLVILYVLNKIITFQRIEEKIEMVLIRDVYLCPTQNLKKLVTELLAIIQITLSLLCLEQKLVKFFKCNDTINNNKKLKTDPY